MTTTVREPPKAGEDGPARALAQALAAFRSGAAEDRERDLLAFALAAQGGDTLSPDTVEKRRREADAALAAWAHRYLHNRIEELRTEAVRDYLGRLPRPPGMIRLTSAAFVGVVLAALALAWLTGNDGLIAAAAARLAGLPAAVSALFAGG